MSFQLASCSAGQTVRPSACSAVRLISVLLNRRSPGTTHTGVAAVSCMILGLSVRLSVARSVGRSVYSNTLIVSYEAGIELEHEMNITQQSLRRAGVPKPPPVHDYGTTEIVLFKKRAFSSLLMDDTDQVDDADAAPVASRRSAGRWTARGGAARRTNQSTTALIAVLHEHFCGRFAEKKS